MKRSLILFLSIALITGLVLSFGVSGCTTTEETSTTPPPTTTTTTTPPPTTTTTTTPPTTTTTTTTTPAEPVEISWEDAKDYIGQLVTVEGPIIDIYDTGTVIALGMGASIFAENTVGIEISYGLAAELPEGLYVGQTIKVTGTIGTNPYGGASISVKDASMIAVVEEEVPPEPIAISWEDAKDYIGQLVTVEGIIIDTFDTGTVIALGMGASIFAENTVGIEISKAILSELPADLYVGQTIRVTGTIFANPYGGASIAVTDVSQIEVVE